MGIQEKIAEIEREMARTQKNKGETWIRIKFKSITVSGRKRFNQMD